MEAKGDSGADELARILDRDLGGDVNIDELFADFDRRRAEQRTAVSRAAAEAEQLHRDSVPVLGSEAEAQAAATRRGNREHGEIEESSSADDDVMLPPIIRSSPAAPEPSLEGPVGGQESWSQEAVSTAPDTQAPVGGQESESGQVSAVENDATGGALGAEGDQHAREHDDGDYSPGAHLPDAGTPVVNASAASNGPGPSPDDVIAQMFASALGQPPPPSSQPSAPVTAPPTPAAAQPQAPTSVVDEPDERAVTSPAAEQSPVAEHTPAPSPAPEVNTVPPTAVPATTTAASPADDPKTGEAEPAAAVKAAGNDRMSGMKTAAADYWAKFRGVQLQYQVVVWLVLLTVIAFVVSQCAGGKTSEATSSGTPVVNEGPATAEAPPAPAQPTGTGVLIPESMEAVCPSGSSRPELAFTAERSEAWICKRAMGIDGATLTVQFRRPVVITEIEVMPGFNYKEASGIDQWNRHRQVTRILWRIGDEQIVQNINPVRTGARLKVNAIATQTVTMMIQETVEPGGKAGRAPGASKSRDDDFAISSIKFIGREA